MKLLTPSTASQIKDAPTKAYLYRVAKSDVKPDYFHFDGDKWMIDISHPEWTELLRKRARGAVSGKQNIPNKKPVEKSKGKPHEPKIQKVDDDLDIADLKKIELQEKIKEKNIKNEILYLKMQKDSGNIIDFDLAKYLFFSYMEKANVDFFRAARKNEAIIDNFVKEGKTREIIQTVERECTSILKEMQKSQHESLEKWHDEQGRKK